MKFGTAHKDGRPPKIYGQQCLFEFATDAAAPTVSQRILSHAWRIKKG